MSTNDMKKSLLAILIFSIILLPSRVNQVCINTGNTQNDSYPIKDEIPIEYFNITITNDENFTDYGFPGTGTKENPFRIENYSIDAGHHQRGIAVVNTTKHFIIQNCYITKTGNPALLLENVFYGTATIQNVTIVSVFETGIMVRFSRGVTIRKNYITYATNGFTDEGYGISLYRSNDTIVSNNICERISRHGIESLYGTNNTFVENNCSNTFNTGFFLYEETQAKIINTTCNFNLRGMILVDSSLTLENNQINQNSHHGCILNGVYNSTITRNSVCNNAKEGLLLTDLRNSTFTENFVCFNGDIGFKGLRIKRCTFTFNQIVNNSHYGLVIDGYSSNNLAHHNRFVWNKPGGTSQAFDSGNNTLWYDQETKEGNYWSDHKRGKYEIDGRADSFDKYPLNSDLESADFYYLSFLLSFPLISFILLRRKRTNIPTERVTRKE
ncbi:MAG: right-handed parallel beta-helix repeat-containing protein [Candidatus Heimdallarchaeota archaeon]|nr:right-handed parallel beta-helix repeat-containing protein [Candidatus Heimdallarchaeota archaeon]MCK4955252.1 right-handed parallel beta-helix repeat-containing protein [Candidatus Heimdallarchaeota archaeon]